MIGHRGGPAQAPVQARAVRAGCPAPGEENIAKPSTASARCQRATRARVPGRGRRAASCWPTPVGRRRQAPRRARRPALRARFQRRSSHQGDWRGDCVRPGPRSARRRCAAPRDRPGPAGRRWRRRNPTSSTSRGRLAGAQMAGRLGHAPGDFGVQPGRLFGTRQSSQGGARRSELEILLSAAGVGCSLIVQQYIEAMFLSRPLFAGFLARLPGSCAICRGWDRGAVCCACTTQFTQQPAALHALRNRGGRRASRCAAASRASARWCGSATASARACRAGSWSLWNRPAST